MEINNDVLESMIAKRLKELRASNNLTCAELALKLNVHRETIRRYEKNPKSMSIDMFLRLLDIYGYETNIFFDEIYGKLPLR